MFALTYVEAAFLGESPPCPDCPGKQDIVDWAVRKLEDSEGRCSRTVLNVKNFTVEPKQKVGSENILDWKYLENILGCGRKAVQVGPGTEASGRLWLPLL